jgi:aryl sulfotransferase
LDGIPYFESCEYLMVYRDPRDVYFSIRHHLQNLLITPDIPQLASDQREGFNHWVVTPFEPGVGEQRCLEAYTQHFNSFWSYRHLNNFHFFHYADMQRNLSANVRRISSILKIDVSEDEIGEVCNAVSFAEMKKNAGVFAPGSGKPVFKSDEAFFNSGRNEQWREILNVGDIQSYKNRINDLLSPGEIQWVENGLI